MVETKKAPMCDIKNSEYATWSNDNGVKYMGLKHNATGEQHGAVRSCYGDIFEYTCKAGQKHGLSRVIMDEEMYIQLYREGEPLATLIVDSNLKEVGRKGNHK